jgi:hypothetical protein
MADPVAQLRYEGPIQVQPYRRGTLLGRDHLQVLIEHALGSRSSFGEGWRGRAVVRIELYEDGSDHGRASPDPP